MRVSLRLALALAAMLGACRNEAAPTEASKPMVHVLTSLPLLFEEGLALEPAQGEAATYLRERFSLKAIDLPSQLPARGVLLAAQPRALPAEELVALDAWVRDGGRLILLADPLLEWPSQRPLGDALRPPISFADTGLLGHWGLRLDAPEKRGHRLVRHGAPKRPGGKALNLRVMTISPGSLAMQSGTCTIQFDGLHSECPVGKGWVWIIADADWLNEQLVNRAGGTMDVNLFALGTVMRAANSTR